MTRDIADVVFLWVLVAAVGGTILAGTCDEAQSQDRAERHLALAVAKTCANEAGFESHADCALIWQTVEGARPTTRLRLRWLRQHSPRVAGTRPCGVLPGNCPWSRNLDATSRRPAGWPTNARWHPERWEAVRAYSARLVSGEEPLRPCVVTPTTWDGRVWAARAAARGFVSAQCVGTRNDGYVRRER